MSNARSSASSRGTSTRECVRLFAGHVNRMAVLPLFLLLGLSACEIAVRRSEPGQGFRLDGPAADETSASERDATLVAAGATLDALHAAADRADGERYFALFTDDAIFLGTDATERWTVTEFRAYAAPHFAAGQGWTYEVVDRHMFLDPVGATAWFDERLANEKYGECRGTGVLRLVGGRWRIAQYNLTIPVPNDLASELVEMIRRGR